MYMIIVAAEVESHELLGSLLRYGNGGGCQVTMHHPDVSTEKAEEQTVLDLSWVDLILLWRVVTTF